MPKRHLTQQQKNRISQHQERHRVNAEATSPDNHDNKNSGVSGRVITRRGQLYVAEDHQGRLIQCHLRRTAEAPVCGDEVIWQEIDATHGVILTLLPRRTILKRPSANGQEKLIAANIDQIVVVCAPVPELNTRLIDRYLVAAELLSITPIIVVNKHDLLRQEELATVTQQLQCYVEANYEVIYTSAQAHYHLDALTLSLQGLCSIFVGQSGVGKSTLLNEILGEQIASTGEVSTATNKGRHTTTAAHLYHLPDGGDIIDSPGVREFGLGDITESQLVQGFREFNQYLGNCQFRDCTHRSERGCAIRRAVDADKISQARYESYLKLREGDSR